MWNDTLKGAEEDIPHRQSLAALGSGPIPLLDVLDNQAGRQSALLVSASVPAFLPV